MDFKTGDILCNCTLLTQCGSGAYGEVWLATDPVGGRVAVKILSQRGSYSERELAGLRNYKDCNHPNLLKIRHIELQDKTIIYTMDAADNLNKDGDYLPDTLANRLRKYGRLEGKEITAMLDGLLSGLEELHRLGLVHRDIKPDNILWVNGRPTLADVELVAAEGQGSLVGTPGFLSPDLLNGKKHADASDDFYALGKVIYCALTGMPVREYPSFPLDKTISVDRVLGRTFLEACNSRINSAADFRELLSGSGNGNRQKFDKDVELQRLQEQKQALDDNEKIVQQKISEACDIFRTSIINDLREELRPVLYGCLNEAENQVIDAVMHDTLFHAEELLMPVIQTRLERITKRAETELKNSLAQISLPEIAIDDLLNAVKGCETIDCYQLRKTDTCCKSMTLSLFSTIATPIKLIQREKIRSSVRNNVIPQIVSSTMDRVENRMEKYISEVRSMIQTGFAKRLAKRRRLLKDVEQKIRQL